jgi:hypothetical protein
MSLFNTNVIVFNGENYVDADHRLVAKVSILTEKPEEGRKFQDYLDRNFVKVGQSSDQGVMKYAYLRRQSFFPGQLRHTMVKTLSQFFPESIGIRYGQKHVDITTEDRLRGLWFGTGMKRLYALKAALIPGNRIIIKVIDDLKAGEGTAQAD